MTSLPLRPSRPSAAVPAVAPVVAPIAGAPPEPAFMRDHATQEARLDAALHHILQRDDVPALSRRLGELLGCLGSDAHSAQRIANLVLRDYGLTIKVVRMANAAHYNRGRRPIRSVTQAMMLLGLDTVRTIATSLLLAEHGRGRAAGVRELLLLSLLSANHAREMAHRLGLGDPEAVQLCGLCRNLGEVLAACHLPATYAAILRLAREAPPGPPAARTTAAARRLLGFAFEDLGDAMLAHWGMPLDVRLAARAQGAPGESLLQLVTAFSHELTTAAYRTPGAEPPDDADVGAPVAAVLARFGGRLRLSADALAEVLATAVTETRELFAETELTLDALTLERQTAAALDAITGRASVAAVAPPAPPGAPAGHRATPAAGTPDGVAALARRRERLLADVAAAVGPAGGHALHQTMLLVLEGLLCGVPVDRAILCLASGDRHHLVGRMGLGGDAEVLAPRLRLALAPAQAPLARALHAGRDVVHPGPGPVTVEVQRLLRLTGARRFAILPLACDGALIGALYVDARADGDALDPARLPFLDALRALAARAIEARHATEATLAPAPPPPVALERRAVVLRLLRGESVEALGAELGVPVATLQAWHDAFLAGATAALGAPER